MKQRVLIVEDDLDLGDIVSSILIELGLDVSWARSGAEAMENLAKAPLPDLILLDLTLPDIKGSDLLYMIRNSTLWKSIVVYVVSGWDDIRDRATEMGADGFIKKPYDLNFLTQEVKVCLGL